MLKILHKEGKSCNIFKCGEIFCVSATVFNVSCYLCEKEMHFDQFSNHFQHQHLSAVEEFFNEKAINSSLLGQMLNKEKDELIKIENDVETPANIAEESPADEEANKSPQEMVIKSKVKKGGRNAVKTITKRSLLNVSNKRSTRSSHSKKPYREENVDDPLHTEEDPVEENKCLQELVIEAKVEEVKINIVEDITESSKLRFSRSKKQYTEESINDPLHTLEVLIKEEQNYNASEDFDNTDSDSDWFAEEKTSENKPDLTKDAKEELPFPCPKCKRCYSTKHGLQKHNYSSHNPNKPPRKRKNAKPPNKCDICNEVFRSAPVLRAHMWKHTGIVCDICGRSFTQSGHLVRHKIRHTGVKEFKCEECTKEFFTAKELKSHMVCHTQIMAAICEICGKGCRNRAVLKEHMRRHTGERPAKCDVCGKCFFSGHDLNVHAVTHTSERPFKCDICGSSFQRKKALRVHKRIHSSERKHVCRICGKGFSQSSSLTTHMRTHDAAVEKTTTSSIESVSAAYIAPALLPNREVENTTQLDSTAVSDGEQSDERLVHIYICGEKKEFCKI